MGRHYSTITTTTGLQLCGVGRHHQTQRESKVCLLSDDRAVVWFGFGQLLIARSGLSMHAHQCPIIRALSLDILRSSLKPLLKHAIEQQGDIYQLALLLHVVCTLLGSL